jgi:prevent-host-death family protein
MTDRRYDDDMAVRGGNTLGVADAKASLSELIERVARGERFLILRRGRPALALVPPEEAAAPRRRPSGLATIAGALEDWEELPAAVEDIYRTRRRAQDRPAPDLG